MKNISFLIALITLIALPVNALAGGFANEKFIKTFYFEYGGKGSQSGLDAGNAKAIADTDIMAIDAGMVIENVYMIIDTAITGTTALTVGDDDGAASWIPFAALTLATPGMYGWDAKSGGAYKRIETAGASAVEDIYVVPAAKYYSVAGKEIKLDNTTANTAGKFRVVVEGFRL